jgi:hypothetical protein
MTDGPTTKWGMTGDRAIFERSRGRSRSDDTVAREHQRSRDQRDLTVLATSLVIEKLLNHVCPIFHETLCWNLEQVELHGAFLPRDSDSTMPTAFSICTKAKDVSRGAGIQNPKK